MSSLHYAAEKGHKENVIELLKGGADPNFIDKDGKTPLHLASQFGHNEIVIELSNYGANLKSNDFSGWTPLHFASLFNHEEVVIILLNSGADPNYIDKYGRSPLHWASWYGNKDTVIELLNRGSDPYTKNKDGKTVFDININIKMTSLIHHVVAILNLINIQRIVLTNMKVTRCKNLFLSQYYAPTGEGYELSKSRFESRF